MAVPEKLKNKKLWVVIAALFGASLLGAGVFASSAITINSGNAVSLGAGSAQVSTPCGIATISTGQYLNAASGTYYTGTFSVDLGTVSSTCATKTLSLAYATGSVSGSATWAIGAANSTGLYTYGYAANSGQGASHSSGLLSAFDTAATNLSTIAIAVQ